METRKPRPVIAISSCLLGNQVRYDGELKHFPELCQQLQQQCDLLPVCPEVEIGLSVPRPPVQLTGDPDKPRMTGRDDPAIDVSDAMYQFCTDKPAQLKHISGYVFKSKSPSCGLHNIPVFNHGETIKDNGRGLFAQAITHLFPQLPVAEETELETSEQQLQFVQQVLDYYKKHIAR